MLGHLMACMASMLKDYKAELEDILVTDKQVRWELPVGPNVLVLFMNVWDHHHLTTIIIITNTPPPPRCRCSWPRSCCLT